MFNNYPYTDFHELNLDWILQKIQEMNTKVENIPTLIQEMLSDDNIKKWLSEYLDQLREQIASADEKDGVTASASRSVGTMVWVDGVLYRVTSPMVAGDKYVDGGNCIKCTVENLAYLILTAVTDLIEPDNLKASADRSVGDLVWFNGQLVKIIKDIKKGASYDVTNFIKFNITDFYKEYSGLETKIDEKINATDAKIDKEVSDRKDLIEKTSDAKAYIKETLKYKFGGVFNEYFDYTDFVDDDGISRKILIGNDSTGELGKVINDYVRPEDYGAVGDGITNDAEAFKAMIEDLQNQSQKAVCLSKKYLVNGYTISLPDYTVLFSDNGKGEIKVTQGTSILVEFGTMCKIQNITLTGDSSTTGTLLTSRVDTLYARIENCTLQNAFKGIDLINAHGCLFSNLHILTCKYGIMFHTNDLEKNNNDHYFVNCDILNATDTAIYIQGRLEALLMTNCTALSCNRNFVCDYGDGTKGQFSYSFFTGCFFDSATQTDLMTQAKDITWTNCWFSNRTGANFCIQYQTAKRIKFIGCKFHLCPGLIFRDTSNVSFTGCTITEISTSAFANFSGDNVSLLMTNCTLSKDGQTEFNYFTNITKNAIITNCFYDVANFSVTTGDTIITTNNLKLSV